MMVFYSTLAAFAVAFLVFAVLASVVAVGALTEVLVSNRRDRLARHQSLRGYYRGFALTH